jgi:uncharacterized coiled-coil DUF342 family protein
MRDARVLYISPDNILMSLLQEVKQYKEECEIVIQKLARIAEIVVNLCKKYNLSEQDLPASLRAILDSLQRCVSSVTIAILTLMI